MKVRTYRVLEVFLALVIIVETGIYSANAADRTHAPSLETMKAIESLSIVDVAPYGETIAYYFTSASDERLLTTTYTPEKHELPFITENTLLIQLKPNITLEQIRGLIKERELSVIDVYPRLGQIRVQGNLSSFFVAKKGDSRNETLLNGMVAIAESYMADERVISATPDIFLSNYQYLNNNYREEILNATRTELPVDEETVDWGIDDIGAEELWAKSGAIDGVLFGVMDAGFSEHEDIIFQSIKSGMTEHFHGNHVAGIACAKHNNFGIRGVLPTCWVKPSQGNFHSPDVDDVSKINKQYIQMSQIVYSLNQFVTEGNETSVYNLSMGYNWMPNFGINPEEVGNEDYKIVVQMQGEFFIAVLEAADDESKYIFSAAGNDSKGLEEPMDTKYASPFNWASITARDRGLAYNGIIVEAHDLQGNRADFSNVGGDISCPGVNILSALSDFKSYGVSSGTSMASPYCAAGFALLKNVNPNKDPYDIVSCMKTGSKESASGAPRLYLPSAHQICSSP